MVTGGFKTLQQAVDAVSDGAADIVGLARILVLNPDLPEGWRTGSVGDPIFPKFASSLKGGITAWYTMRLTAVAEDREATDTLGLKVAVKAYEDRDFDRIEKWNSRFKI